MPLHFSQTFKNHVHYPTKAPKDNPRTTITEGLHFKVELLEATIPTLPDTQLPAQPILFHEHWEPAKTVHARLQCESKENLVSYRWLEEHISRSSQTILSDGKKILLVWKFLCDRREFRTAHEVVHIEGVYALIFNRNRPTYSSNVASLFEEELASHVICQHTEQRTLLGKWKDRILPGLQYYLHIWRQSYTSESNDDQGIHDREDGITLLGDLVCDHGDEDWVYVTILDMESTCNGNTRLETTRHGGVKAEPCGAMQVQLSTSGLDQEQIPSPSISDSNNNLPGNECRIKHGAQNVPMSQAYSFDYIPCDSTLTYGSESQSRASWGQTRNSLISDTSFNNTSGFNPPLAEQQAFLPEDCALSSPDNQDQRDPSPVLSRVSSMSIDIPYPDDYWTWSEENRNHFHIRTKLDGTEETIWYPADFTQPQD
ncbi:hypothetical protein F5Y13DRAFT_190909 [Hypoxylon sp. FL1857]|nr:hypothetical protein F5Y13DRAFT_190909 [Hypoxylon sp. FL1857]